MPLALGDRLLLAGLAGAGEDDEAGEVFGFGAEAVPHPRAHAWAPGDQTAGVHEGVGGVVVDGFGLHGTDNADLLGDAGDVREELGDFLAGLGVLAELERR